MYPFHKTGFKTHQISIEVDNFNQFLNLNHFSLYIAWPGMTVLYGTSDDKIHTRHVINQHKMTTQYSP